MVIANLVITDKSLKQVKCLSITVAEQTVIIQSIQNTEVCSNTGESQSIILNKQIQTQKLACILNKGC